jgi:signal transduction histidine kinase
MGRPMSVAQRDNPHRESEPTSLRRQLREATEALEAARKSEQRLREANRLKDEFLATLAHELRNPLAPIRTAAHLLTLRGTEDPSLRQLHELIGRQAAHMARLVDDLLDVSRIERGQVQLRTEPLDLGAVVAHAVEVYGSLFETCEHRLALNLPAPGLEVDGDPARLEQMVCNLLNNACKYTPPGGDIRVSLQREDDQAVLRVRDSGIGLTPEAITSIFDLFYQVGRNGSGREGGLGIGLTLARRLAELHGGSITAASEGLGLGSEFSLSLPVRQAQSAVTVKPAPPAASAVRPRQVLIIDDNESVLTSLGLLLQARGYQVSLAATGEAGVSQALALRPDLALVDLVLPGLNGLQVARRLRAEWGGAIRLIALSGYSRPKDIAAALAAGFDRHLVKSADPNALLLAIAELLN